MAVSYRPLRYHLRKRGISVRELGRALNLPPYAMAMLEKDLLLPPSVLGEICAYLSCELSQVVEINGQGDAEQL